MTSLSRRASLEYCDDFKPQSWNDVFINFRLLYLPITKIITIFAHIFIRSGDNTKNTALQTMNKDIKKFLDFPTESSAQIINRKEVEVTAPDGEVFTVYCQIGALLNEETRNYELHWLEVLFDKNFSLDKEGMVQNIWREAMQFGIEMCSVSAREHAILIVRESGFVSVKFVKSEEWKLVTWRS